MAFQKKKKMSSYGKHKSAVNDAIKFPIILLTLFNPTPKIFK